MTNVEELKGLLERATKGPWRYDDGKILTPSNERLRVSGTSQPSGYVPDEDESYANAELIVAAVNALPALLEERERLIAALNEISEGRGRFSLDQFEHARNTIEDMKEIALTALSGSAPHDPD